MPVEPGQTLDVIAQDEAEQRRCIEMAASQLRLVLEGQRLPRGSVYQPPSKLGAGGPPQPQLPPHRISLHPLAMA